MIEKPRWQKAKPSLSSPMGLANNNNINNGPYCKSFMEYTYRIRENHNKILAFGLAISTVDGVSESSAQSASK